MLYTDKAVNGQKTIALDVYVPNREHQAAQDKKGDVTARRNGTIYYNNIVGKFNTLLPEIEVQLHKISKDIFDHNSIIN